LLKAIKNTPFWFFTTYSGKPIALHYLNQKKQDYESKNDCSCFGSSGDDWHEYAGKS
jgi:hypothetical protein